MFEWLAALKLNSFLGEGIRSLASTAAKGVGARVGSEIIGQFGPKMTGDPFAEHGPIADAIRPLQLDASEKQNLTAFFNTELFASVVRASPALAVGGGTNAQRTLIDLYLLQILPNKPRVLLSNLASEIVLRLQHASNAALEEALEAGLVFPNQAAAGSTHSIVAAEIASVVAQVTEATPYSLDQLRGYEIFEDSYRRQVGRQYAKLKPEALGDAKPVPIYDLYVASDLRPLRAPLSDPTISREELLKASFRTVILGNPGGGKSTFVKKLCHELATRYDQALYGERRLTPIVIILREYAQYRKRNPCSILEYATVRARADFQMDQLPEGAIRYLFITGRAIVIFDGLDELVETADRLDVTQVVERFVDQYQATPILVTSREVGYEQAPLDPEKFDTYKLQPFNAEQMARYVKNWFSVTREGTIDAAKELADAFVRDSEVVPDLRENPLMLSLLCNLYKKDKHLPSNRPDVYKRCADLLFENWDKFRGIVVTLPIEKKLRPAMNHLAHWIYADKTLQTGVTEKAIVAETSNYLSKWCIDKDDAIATAEKFVTFFRGRAWVFSDVGSSKSQSLYGFTHRTFLEFFTADYIVKHYATSGALSEYLLPRLLNREWDVVCQLCYQLYADLHTASDELTTNLLEEIKSRKLPDQLKLASFLSRTLDLIFPTRTVRAEAVTVAIRVFTSWVTETASNPNPALAEEAASIAAEIWTGLTSCDRDLRDVNVENVKREIIAYISSDASDESKAALLVAFDFIKTSGGELEFLDRERVTTWNDANAEISRSTIEERLRLNANFRRLAQSSWWEGEINLLALLDQHGIQGVLENIPSPIEMWVRPNILSILINMAISPNSRFGPAEVEDATVMRDWLVSNRELPLRSGIGQPVAVWRTNPPDAKWPLDQAHRDLIALSVRGGQRHGFGPAVAKDLDSLWAAKKDPKKLEEALSCLAALKLSKGADEMMREWLLGH